MKKIMQMKKLIPIILVFFTILFPNNTKAQPVMGGEITWECIPAGQADAGKFIFYMRLYGDCADSTLANTQNLQSNSPVSNIPLSLISSYPKEITKVCNETAFTGVNFINCNDSINTNGAVSEYLYKSNPVMLNAVPPISGWTFHYSSCCRNYTDNLASQYGNYFLRAKMYPYYNLSNYPCFDNTPVFVEPAQPIISGGYPATISNKAFDIELDSVTYEWGLPMEYNGTPVTYNAGYSYSSPLPDTSQNINNVAASMEPYSGLIHYESHTEGMYLMSTKVSSFKYGILLAEQWREILVKINNQTNNSPPVFDIGIDTNNNLVDTVFEGDTVSFTISTNDIQFLPNGSSQLVSFNAFSNTFGEYIPASGTTPASYSTTTGCTTPPCATLTPAPSAEFPITGILGTQTQFNWIATFKNTPGGSSEYPNIHKFFYKANDDYCPLPADNYIKHTIVVRQRTYDYSTKIECINKLQNNDFEMKWNPINDTTNRFLYYLVHITEPNGNISTDTIYNMGTNTYVYNNIANYNYIKCSIETKGNFCHMENHSWALKNLELSSFIFHPCQNNLQWTALSDNNNSSVNYKIFRREENTPWILRGSTTSTTYYDQPSVDKNYYYKIQSEDVIVYDSLGNSVIKNSSSNIIKITQFLNLGSDTSICINHNITLNSNNFLATVYLWSNGSTDSYLDIMGSDLGLGSHDVWLAATNADGCSTYDTIQITVDACTSIDEISAELLFEVLPNPSDGEFIVKLNTDMKKECYYEIIDMKGAVIIRNNVLEKEFKIDISDYPASNYLLRIKSGDRISQRILILR